MKNKNEENLFLEKKEEILSSAPKEEAKPKNILNLKLIQKIKKEKKEKNDRTHENYKLIRYVNKNKVYSIIIKLFIYLNLFMNSRPNNELLLFVNHLSIIKLKIPGPGIRKIFNDDINNYEKQYYPYKIYINGEPQTKVNYSYYLNQTNNTIELDWKKILIVFVVCLVIVI